MPTRTEMEFKAMAEYQEVLGKTVLVRLVSGYKNENCDDIACDPPAKMKVVATCERDIKHRVYDWLDPYWNVEIVEPHPTLKDVTSMWVFGTSYRANGDVQPTTTHKLEGA